MPAHLITETSDPSCLRPRVSGANYCGRHRAASGAGHHRPGALVIEPGSPTFSSIVRLVDAETAVVRHVGGFDDHTVALRTLQALSARIRVGADFSDSD
jgi:hypothetical protein